MSSIKTKTRIVNIYPSIDINTDTLALSANCPVFESKLTDEEIILCLKQRSKVYEVFDDGTPPKRIKLQNINADLHAEAQQELEEKKKLEQEYKTFKQKEVQYLAKIAELEEDLKYADIEGINKLQAERDKAIADLAEAQKTMEGLQTTITEKDANIAELTSQIATLNQTIVEKNDTISNLNITISTKESENATLQETNANLSSQINNLTTQIGSIQGELTNKTEELNTTKATLDEKIAEIETLNNSINDKQTLITNLNEQVQTLTSDKTKLEEQVATLTSEKEALTTEKTKLEEQVATLTQEKTTLEEQVATLTSEKEELTTEKTKLEEQVQTLTSDKSNLEGQVSTLTSEKETLTQEKTALSEQVSQLTSDKSALETKLSTSFRGIESSDIVFDYSEYTDIKVTSTESEYNITGNSLPSPTVVEDNNVVNVEAKFNDSGKTTFNVLIKVDSKATGEDVYKATVHDAEVRFVIAQITVLNGYEVFTKVIKDTDQNVLENILVVFDNEINNSYTE